MRSLLIGLGALSTLATLIFLLSLDGSEQDANRAGSTPTDSITKVEVVIKENSLDPNEVQIDKGTRVVWTNSDSEEHRLVSNIFGSSNIKEGQSWSYLFSESGEFTYHCAIHPEMEGKIVVK